jgi:hypothetical protein|tara:strand:+ start:1157 stop:1840 length:684 start_codon:yes stop_codon:yes gene_type:complete
MPLYEFANKDNESVGELFLTLEQREDFLRQNPNLHVVPGKLRYAAHKSAESFPSYPDMDNETKPVEERGQNFEPPVPASWKDSDEDTGKTGFKITDKRKVQRSHFDEDIKKYGKIVGTPKMLGDSSTDFHIDKVDSDKPITPREEYEYNQKMESEDKQGQLDRRAGMKGLTSGDAIHLSDSQELMPWEQGFSKANKKVYDEAANTDQNRIKEDKHRERVKLGLEDED